MFVTILLTAILWQCHGAQASDDENTESVKRVTSSYSAVLKRYTAVYKGKCDALNSVDGCDLFSGRASLFYQVIFTPACLRHDICYGCVST